MWKLTNGKLVQTTDQSRVKFRTNISKSLIVHLSKLADEYDSHPNYLLENGLQNLLSHGTITFNKALRPKDRVQYKTTYDKELLAAVKEFASENTLYTNDVLEYSVSFIDFKTIKNSSYKHRVE
ncbi:rRNA methyltransferase [Metabacillus litoralis]|uniref:rRNA methyltransferase n=1 Tax=Metabacillus litoralis TaxID=152268 RepID=UPI001CFF2C3B|nr:rRNA methyltransferase [Metabacillus litoralis]